jgi:hypothetical protein
MTHPTGEIPHSLHPRELQPLAQALLRSHGVELFDDPRTEVEVAVQLGFLSLNDELGRTLTLGPSEV